MCRPCGCRRQDAIESHVAGQQGDSESDPSRELSGKLVNLQELVGKRGLEASGRENEFTERQIAIVEIATVFTHTFQLTS